MNRVVITGMGLVCANAANKEEFARASVTGKQGMKKCTVFSTKGLLTDYFGEAESVTEGDRLFELIRLSCGEMMEDCGMTPEKISAFGTDCRLFYGTLLSSAGYYYKHSLAKANGETDKELPAINDYAAYVKELTGVKGAADVSCAACASGTTAAGMAFDYIRSGICSRAVIGGADALSIISGYGFNALRSLSSGICSPWDSNRDGINIGECGVFFMAQTLESALEEKAHIYCELCGAATGNDGYHITSPNPDGSGAYNTMKNACSDGGAAIDSIDYINVHGTGTRINDAMESKAIADLFGSCERPLISSTKAQLGHCMGASGLIELASVIFSMNEGRYIPMPELKDPIDGNASAKSFDVDISCALSDSFAFGGSSASILIKKYSDGGDPR